MRTLFDTEEEEEVKASEITLSTASLLGIFFGLVLICGVFFGFGYSMGRGTGQKTQAHALENIPATNPSDGDETANAEPPSAAAPDDPPASAKAASPAVKENAAPEEDTPAKPQPPASPKPAALKSVPAYVPPVEASPSASGKPMVQIAAVARPEDAYVLVNALRQRGYSVVVRNEPQDKLLHVQVGPFADLTQAATMKQKLLSDGYNAIIKQ
jgi:cell division septation protein DedD